MKKLVNRWLLFTLSITEAASNPSFTLISYLVSKKGLTTFGESAGKQYKKSFFNHFIMFDSLEWHQVIEQAVNCYLQLSQWQ